MSRVVQRRPHATERKNWTPTHFSRRPSRRPLSISPSSSNSLLHVRVRFHVGTPTPPPWGRTKWNVGGAASLQQFYGQGGAGLWVREGCRSYQRLPQPTTRGRCHSGCALLSKGELFVLRNAIWPYFSSTQYALLIPVDVPPS